MEFSKQKMMLILTTLSNVITQAVTVYESDRIAESDSSKLDKETRENPGSGEKNRKPSAVGAATKKGSLKLTRKQISSLCGLLGCSHIDDMKVNDSMKVMETLTRVILMLCVEDEN